MLISLPRLCPKGAAVTSDGKKYINMEDKIHEYSMFLMSKDLFVLFIESDTNGEYTNDVRNIIAKIARVRDNDVLIEPFPNNEKFFEEYKGKIAVRIVSISEMTETGIYVHKIIRFEAVIKSNLYK